MLKKRNLIFLSLLILGALLLSSCFSNPPVTEGVLKGQVIVPEGTLQAKDLTGQALPDATVNIIDPATGDIIATTTTDADGYYQVFVPEGGPYILQAIKDGVKVQQVTSQVEIGIEYDLGTADCATTASALIAQAMLVAEDYPDDLADINLTDIETDPDFDDVMSDVCSKIAAGEDPAESALVQQAVEDFLHPPAPPALPPPPTPLTAIGEITGTAKVGETLTAGALTPSGATADYQWQICATSGGTYAIISGATSTTYTPVADDVTKFIKVAATGTGNYTGTVTSDPTEAVTAATLESIAITNPTSTLSYSIGDALDITGLVVTGTYSDATTKVETITTGNITGFNSSAPAIDQVLTITVGGKTTTYTVNIVATPLTAIAAITGTAKVGETLTAGDLTPSGATATYQWQICTTSDGTYEDISGATTNTYTPVAGDVDKFIKVAATGTGNYSGNVTSTATAAVENGDQAAPTGLEGVAPTTYGGSDGKITGTTTDMEYKLSTATGYTTATVTEITGLVAGTYNVRYAAKTGYNAGTAANIIVPALAIGHSYGGGIVAYILEEGEKLYDENGEVLYSYDADAQHGLIAATADQSDGIAWSNITNTSVGTTGTAIGTGRANTTAIIGQEGHTASAAKVCDDYTNTGTGTGVYSDWFLPSKDELAAMRTNLASTPGDRLLYGFADSLYWSSSEDSAYDAWVQHFYYGSQDDYNKSYNYYVRAVRAF